MIKYAVYVRKSSEDKKAQVQSIEDQIKVLKELAKNRGLKVIEIIDDKKSAKAPGRPGFNKLIDKIHNKEIDGVLCWKLDRLARNPVDGGSISWLLQEGNIKEIVTPDRTHYPTDNVLLVQLEFGMANQFIQDLRKNVKRGMNSKLEKGWFPSKAPLGYINEIHAIKGTKRILPDKELFPVIQNLWKIMVKGKHSLADLYRHMQEHCPIYSNGRILHFSSFHRLFHNPFYVGVFTWNGEQHLGAHKPMISKREYEKVQTILDNGAEIRQRDLEFDLKGAFHCSHCNAILTAEQHVKKIKKTGETKTYKYYRCAHRKNDTDCKEKPIAETDLEEQIIEVLEKTHIPDEIIEFGLEELDKQEATMTETFKEKQIKKEIHAIEQRIKSTYDAFFEESDEEIRDMAKSRLNSLKIDKRNLEQDLEYLEKQKKNPYADIKDSLKLIIGMVNTFKNGDSAQKKAILNCLGSNWEMGNKNILFEPKDTTTALQMTKNSHKGLLSRFELSQGSLQNKKLPSEAVSLIWSG